MRILFCNYEYPPLGGGGGVINAFLAEELAKRHEVTVLTSRAFDLAPESVERGVRVLRVPVFFRKSLAAANFPSMLAYLPMGVLRGRDLLRAGSVDVINTHFALPSGPLGQMLSNRYSVPNVLSLHGGDLYDPSKWTSPHRHRILRSWVSRLARQADAVVAQSHNTLENLHRYFVPEVDASIIPLGIPRPPAVTASRRDFNIDDNETVMVVVGRLVKRKNIGQLIEVVSRLPEHVRLLIIGSGPEEQALRERASGLGIAGRVTFVGQVSNEDKFRLLSIADLFVSTSFHEGFGLVFLEAMALGLPVICYANGGQTDYLVDGKSGYLVDLNDVTTFEQRCLQLCQRADLRREIAAWNRECVEAFFIDHCARQYETLFESVLSRGATARLV